MIYLYYFYHKLEEWASLTHALETILIGMIMTSVSDMETRYYLAVILLCNNAVYFCLDFRDELSLSDKIHHLLAVLTCYYALLQVPNHQTVFIAQLSSLLELTGPYWTGLRVQLKESKQITVPKWYNKTIAGIFFICWFIPIRLMVFPYMVYFEGSRVGISKEALACLFFPTMSVNCYWAFLLIKGTIKALFLRDKNK